MPPARIEPVYRPLDEGGRFLLFDGDLQLETEGTAVPAQVDLEIFPETKLLAHLLGPAAVSARVGADAGDEPEFSIPDGVDLTPPAQSALSKRDGVSRAEFRLGQLHAGDLNRADRLLFHISGALEALAPPQELDGGGSQPQLEFSLPGWDLVLAPGNPTPDCRDFAAVVQATPTSSVMVTAEVERLHRWLFILFGFLANREVGIGPVCGLDESGRVVWTQWDAPRVKPGRPGVKWCPPLLTSTALPRLAAGLSTVAEDSDLEVIVDRDWLFAGRQR
jgi:hypothetical protein